MQPPGGPNNPLPPGAPAQAGGPEATERRQNAGPRRTDFIILFAWKEPLPSEERAGRK
jgi:hypothetical protein